MNRSQIQHQIDGLKARVQQIRTEIDSILEARTRESDDAKRKWWISQLEDAHRRGDETWEEIHRLEAML